MKTFLSSLLTAVTLVLVAAGLSFGQTVPVATWPLETSTADSVTSNVAVDTEGVAGLSAGYTTTAPTGTTLNVQKLKPNASTSDNTNGTGSWPVETAYNPARYVQFALTPQANFSAYVDSISMLVGAQGMKGINATVFYSTHGDFSDSTYLASLDTVVENAVMDTTLGGMSVSLNPGDTLFVRVFPWTNVSSTSTTKYLYIGNVVADGYAMTTPMAVNGLWGFQADSLGDSLSVMSWGPGNAAAVVAPDTIDKSPTHHIYEFFNRNYNSAAVLGIVLPAGKTMADYDMFNFKVFMAQGDVGQKTFIVQAYKQEPGPGDPFGAKADTVNIGSFYRSSKVASTAWENISIPIAGSYSMSDTVYLAFGFNSASGTVWYADSIQLVASTSSASPVALWGITPQRNNAGWHLAVTGNGDSANFNGGLVKPWEGVRGAFKHPMVATTAANGAVVVSGKVTFVGEGPDSWSALRYGVFNNLIPGTLKYAGTDSVEWAGFAENSYGYMFTPQSGTVYTGNIPGGTGASQGVTMGNSWISTYGGAIGYDGLIQQAPARAPMSAGTYDFAISVHPLANGTKRVNFYLIQEAPVGKPAPYWYGGSFIDTTSQMRSDSLNAVCFGVEGGTNMTGMILSDVVDSLGPDIGIPAPPWQDYYLTDWGFYGGRTGGWKLYPQIIGNTTISGDSVIPDQQWAAVRGAFVGNVSPINGTDSALVITGNLDFTGGSFQRPESFEFGIFNSMNPGSLDSTKTNGYEWTGTEENNYGYLFIPPSGNGGATNWVGATDQQGTFGGVIDRPWLSTNGDSSYVLGTTLQAPRGAVADTGMYNFAIAVAPQPNGSQVVTAVLTNSDSSYVWEGQAVDTHVPLAAKSFNSIDFGIEGGNSTTTLAISNVYVTMALAPKLAVPLAVQNNTSNLPKTFALDQNYPNPFNPSTVIQYQLPKESNVNLKLYNVLGQEVATLFNGKETAGTYKVTVNMDQYASGVYFVRMVAGNYTHIDKMMLLK